MHIHHTSCESPLISLDSPDWTGSQCGADLQHVNHGPNHTSRHRTQARRVQNDTRTQRQAHT